MDKLSLHQLSNNFLSLEEIGYDNPYDFSQVHRHNYLEVILCENEGGKQWVDFNEIDLNPHSCYITLPKQVHLLKRNQFSKGKIIQFTETTIQDNILLSTILRTKEAVVFENKEKLYLETLNFMNLIGSIQSLNNPLQKSILTNLIHSLIYFLLSCLPDKNILQEGKHLQFTSLIEENYQEWHTVSVYAKKLNISENKLSLITKTHYGQTPLQMIHNRILLEAKRLLHFEKQSIKEIAYTLGFNYLSHFSQFIKSKTGLTATQLQQQVKSVNL